MIYGSSCFFPWCTEVCHWPHDHQIANKFNLLLICHLYCNVWRCSNFICMRCRNKIWEFLTDLNIGDDLSLFINFPSVTLQVVGSQILVVTEMFLCLKKLKNYFIHIWHLSADNHLFYEELSCIIWAFCPL